MCIEGLMVMLRSPDRTVVPPGRPKAKRPPLWSGKPKARRGGIVLVALMASSISATAATIDVPAGSDLRAAIAAAAPGDVLNLAPGDYPGNLVIDKPLTLRGPADRGARILGERTGRTIWVKAEDVALRHLTAPASRTTTSSTIPSASICGARATPWWPATASSATPDCA